MEIDANIRRLSVGAALSEAGSQYSVQHWSRSLESPLRAAVCKPKTLFETSHDDGAVLPFARAALYQDGFLAAAPSYTFSEARLALNALAGVAAARKPSCYRVVTPRLSPERIKSEASWV